MASANLSLPEGFGNVVRLFPLPNLVLFPGLVQALHIFEPRYRQLMADALDSDQLISLALLQPPRENKAVDRIFSTICIGKIISHVRMNDGRFNLILAGVCRARIVEELPQKKLYRMARVDLPEEVQPEFIEQEKNLRDRIVRLYRQQLERTGGLPNEEIAKWLDSDMPLGNLCDLVAFASSSNPLNHFRVLDEFNVRARAELLIDLLANQSIVPERPNEKFPPDFSVN